MRVRFVAITVLAAASLAACSSSSSGKGSVVSVAPGAKTSSTAPASGSSGSGSVGSGSASGGSSGGSPSALCAQLLQAQTDITGLAGDVSDPASLKTALDQEAGFLAKLKASAPPDLAASIDDLVTLLQGAESALSNPSAPDLTKLNDLATKVPADAEKIAAYVEKNCPSLGSS